MRSNYRRIPNFSTECVQFVYQCILFLLEYDSSKPNEYSKNTFFLNNDENINSDIIISTIVSSPGRKRLFVGSQKI